VVATTGVSAFQSIMRRIVLVAFAALVSSACSRVTTYHDAGGDPPKEIDALVELVCDDQPCGTLDECCPSGCHANNDGDCAAVCDNGVIEGDETCDPLTSCVTACPAIGCQLRALSGAGTCQAECVDAGLQTVCRDGDGCCPSGCTANNDAECASVCGNGEVEAGETCDPLATCPTACPAAGCAVYSLFNAGTCQAQCVQTGTIGACIDGDGCCPTGCNANNDRDCTPVCGNNVIEPGETCDGASCVCPAESLSCFTQTGSAATCDVVCHVPQQRCGIADGCCPWVRETGGAECYRGSDGECAGRWQVREWPQAISWAPCTNVRIYAVEGRDSMLLTTCSPTGGAASGDPVIGRIVDDRGNAYAVGNDDCTEPGAIPNLAGWDCRNDQGQVRMACASANSGGFLVRDGAFYLDVEICGFNGGSGRSRLWIWWNGNGNPNPG
jgi:hypothetical protein